MKKLFLILTFGWQTIAVMAAEQFVSFTQGDFLLNRDNRVGIFVEPTAPRGVLMAARSLCRDIETVCGAKASIIDDKTKASITVSVVPDGRWEAYQLVVNAGRITITGSDRRGAIYGIYEISRQIGVSPWYWWADAPIAHHDRIYIKKGTYTDGEPKVKYRGIFINDEAPSFTGWSQNRFGGVNAKMYVTMFELLLRLKANYLWPAMWCNAFNEDEPMCPVMADSMGIVMGTSHHEPMMRAHKEYTRRRKSIGPWDYITNRERVNKFFTEGLERNKAYDNVITIGMRGDGDSPMGKGNDNENIATLKDVIANQRQIINKVFDGKVEEVPQLWAIFTEVQRYYDRGLTVPDDVIKLFCDNNWGYIRRTGPEKERRADGTWKPMGLYYHIDMNGGPWNNRWINCEPIPKLREQLNLAYRTGLDDLWIINVGDLKPKELAIDFMLNYAWNPERIGPADIENYLKGWARSIFGEQHADAIADIVARYTKYNGMRHPETQDSRIFSVMNHHEADRMIAAWDALAQKADSVKALLPKEAQDAYYQLVYYPTMASAGVAEIYLYAGKNQAYAAQGRPVANQFAEKVAELYKRDKALQAFYNDEMAGGKWRGMMQDGHFGYTKWSMPKKDSIPATQTVEPLAKPTLGIAVEGGKELPTFDNMDNQTYYVDIYNKGVGRLDCRVKANERWLAVSREGKFSIGTGEETRQSIHILWDKLPDGRHEGTLTISGGKDKRQVKVVAVKKALPKTSEPYFGNLTGREFSIPAAAYTSIKNTQEAAWTLLPDLGRAEGDMGIWPVTARSCQGKQAPRLDYNVYFDEAGNATLLVGVLPTQDVNPTRGLRIAVAIDDAEPVVLDARQGMLDTFREYTPTNLKKSQVLSPMPRADRSFGIIKGNGFCRNGLYDAVRWLNTTLSVSTPGMHKLHVYMVDPEVVLERIIVNPDNEHPSYMGAGEIKH